MKELFLEVLKNYTNEKLNDFKDNPVAVSIRNGAITVANSSGIINDEKYITKGSAGEGKWADIPWIAVFDKDITDTAMKGYYIVYLFCADMSGMYLSLNQGWTEYKDNYGATEGVVKIQMVSSEWKNKLSPALTDFSFKRIDLMNRKKGNTRAKGYELGHICGKYYSVDNIPSNTELVKDLRNMLGVYRELKGRLKEGSSQKTNNNLIADSIVGLPNLGSSGNELNGIEQFIANSNGCLKAQPEIEYDDSPWVSISKGKKKIKSSSNKNNYIEKAIKQMKIGLVGELMILNYEIKFLKDNDRKELAEKVRHIAKEDDSAGYDILSFHLDGTEKYIEVKTTMNSKRQPFYITPNELKCSQENLGKYYVYRVYECKNELENIKFCIIQGDLKNILDLKPVSYIVEGLLDPVSI